MENSNKISAHIQEEFFSSIFDLWLIAKPRDEEGQMYSRKGTETKHLGSF